jgi:glycosyltransferase involved in cell wall biosynthesis
MTLIEGPMRPTHNVVTLYSRESVKSEPSPKNRPTITAVIPTLNEAENLPHVLPIVGQLTDEVILVDGRSTDKTVEVARKILPSIRIVEQTGSGKGDALRSGFEKATGDIIVMLDADGSTNPAEIPLFVGALLAGADFAKGTRFAQGGGSSDMSFIRNMGNRAFVIMVRALYGGRYSDLCYGYNAFWSDVVTDLRLDSDGFEVETAMNIQALRAGLKIVEVPSFEEDRIHGTSNLRAIPDGFRVLRTILRKRMQPAFKRSVRPSAPDPIETHPVVERADASAKLHG